MSANIDCLYAAMRFYQDRNDKGRWQRVAERLFLSQTTYLLCSSARLCMSAFFITSGLRIDNDVTWLQLNVRQRYMQPIMFILSDGEILPDDQVERTVVPTEIVASVRRE